LNFSSLNHLFEGGFCHKLIWSSLAPSKVSFIVWEAPHKKILTSDNLQKRRKILVNRCYMCKGSWNWWITCCFIASLLWELAFSCLGMCWVSSDFIMNHLLLGRATLVGKLKRGRPWLFLMWFFGTFGEKETKGSLRMKKLPFSA